MARLSVLMCSEGTYPHHEGGVSVWCDQLIRGLPQVDFRVFAITHGSNQPKVFPTPPNVVSVQAVPLWGTQEPGCQDTSFAETYLRRSRTTTAVVRAGFLHPFQEIVRCIACEKELDSFRMGNAMRDLHLYFSHFDFVKSMASAEAWEAFLRVYGTHAARGEELTLHDATTCMRWLQRFLSILAVPLPEVDITHTSMAGLAGVPGVLNKLTRGTPFILTEHGIFLRELYLSIMRTGYSEACRHFLLNFNRAIATTNYHFADAVTTLGNFNKTWQRRLGVAEEKIVVTPNGVDPARFRLVHRDPEAKPVVLTMARISRIKGIEFLLRAAALVCARVPCLRFRILGEAADAKYFEYCKQIVADCKLQDHVEFGMTKDAPAAYSGAAVFCLPSISEGMPFSILEAMFSGCAVVATDVGNVSEMLSGTGILVPPADPESLARALISLLEGDGAYDYRSSLGRAALQRAQSLYTSEQAINRFKNLYVSVNSRKPNHKLNLAAV